MALQQRKNKHYGHNDQRNLINRMPIFQLICTVIILRPLWVINSSQTKAVFHLTTIQDCLFNLRDYQNENVVARRVVQFCWSINFVFYVSLDEIIIDVLYRSYIQTILYIIDHFDCKDVVRNFDFVCFTVKNWINCQIRPEFDIEISSKTPEAHNVTDAGSFFPKEKT